MEQETGNHAATGVVSHMRRIKMRIGLIIAIAVAFLFVGFAAFARGKQETSGTEEQGNEITSLSGLETYDGLSTALSNDEEIVVYDVRTAEEYAAGHIPGAINIPYDVIGSQIPVKEKDTTIVVYCRSGNRSGRARATLESLGYFNIADFGAVSKWRSDLKRGSTP